MCAVSTPKRSGRRQPRVQSCSRILEPCHTKDILCTRFATELVLRRDVNTKVEISVTAGHGKSESERDRLANVHFDFNIARPDLRAVVERAKEAMGLSDDKQGVQYRYTSDRGLQPGTKILDKYRPNIGGQSFVAL